MKKIHDLKIAFFGTGPLAESALITLTALGIKPLLLVTKKDMPVGRSQEITPPLIKKIAEELGITVTQPASLKNLEENSPLLTEDFDLFIVASYGNIIPGKILDIPLFGTLNIHPSYLPQYRGPTPLETALIEGDKDMGITIMVLDELVDHGPILTQKHFDYFSLMKDATILDFEKLAGTVGAEMLASSLEAFITGGISVVEQNHENATFTKKLDKETGLVNLEKDSLEKVYHLWRACTPWPSVYFFFEHKDKKIRVKITEMKNDEEGIRISKVIPEGKKEMSYESFLNGYKK
jgi:methionyl-tRNA formyltransferase